MVSENGGQSVKVTPVGIDMAPSKSRSSFRLSAVFCLLFLFFALPVRARPIDDVVIDYLAAARCMVLTGFADRQMTLTMTKMKIRKFNKLGADFKESVEQMEAALDAQLNGVSQDDYQRILNSWHSGDCNGSVISSIAVDYPTENAASITIVLMMEGFFEDNFEKLRKPIYKLCSEPDYVNICDRSVE